MTSKKALLLAVSLLSITPILHGASDVSVLKGLSKGGAFAGTNPKVFKPKKAKATASKGTVQSTLNLGKGVSIKTGSNAAGAGDLIFGEAVSKIKGRNSTLTLDAVRDINIKAAIGSTKNALPLVLKAGRGITSSAAINTNGGNVTIDTVEPFVLDSALSTGVGHVLLQSGRVQSSKSVVVTTSAVEVFAGASWRLHGTIAGNLSVGGTVAAGAQGIGALQVTGAMALQPGGAMVVNLGGLAKGSGYGSIAVTGPVTLNGALQLDCINGFEDLIIKNHSFTILTAGSITGEFTGLPNGGRVFLPDELGSLKITYTDTTVVLNDWEPIIIDQTWDPGDLDDGTFVYTNARVRGKRHYFRVHTQETDIGAWRTRLNPAQGEADLYMSKGVLPVKGGGSKRSENVGTDGFVLNANEFKAGEEWFILVYADPGTPWKMFTGRAYVQDLGTLQWTDSDSSGTYNIGEPVIPSATGDVEIKGEGMRFFKTVVPAGTPAWSLWLNGSTKDIAVRKSIVPFHAAGLFDRKQSGQMLVVPPYLGSGLATYFVSVVGSPGEAVNLDSRLQEVKDLQFDSTVNNVLVPDAPYRVYRVQVPVDEIAWDVSTVAITGDPNVAVRRDSVPAEFDNDAFSEVPGGVNDSITLVPQFLTDGTWFITVYGKSGYSFTLRNGPPVVTPIQFTDQKINDQPNRVGWRFYGLTDIQSQLGVLGWALELANHVEGTEIAIRRNAIPSRWRSRKNGLPAITNANALDASGIEALQRPGHQADIWYVGVYMPLKELGAFTLSCHPLEPPTMNFDGGARTITNIEPGQFSYVRIDVPPGVIGWDIRIRNASGANPAIAVRRDQLPALNPSNQLTNLAFGLPSATTTWPTGSQWVGGLDWTGYSLDGPSLPAGNRLVMGMGQPLEPGTYYVGVYNNSTSTLTTCTVESYGVGPGQTYQVTPVAYDGGTATITNLAPREARYFKVTIPPNRPSWELLLNTESGEGEMVVRRSTIPDFAAGGGGEVYDLNVGNEIEMSKLGPERYVLLPQAGNDVIPEGDYYIAVIGEGIAPSGSTIGTGVTNATLVSVGPLLVTNLGTASAQPIERPIDIAAGQIVAYQFDVPPDTVSMEVRLDERVNPSAMALIFGSRLPKPAGAYGADGGIFVSPAPLGDSDSLIYTVSNPPSGKCSLVINAGTTSPAQAILRIKALGVVPVAFDGGTSTVLNHEAGTVRYFVVDVPAGAEGWDVRMRDLTSPGTLTMPTMAVRRDFVTGPPVSWSYWSATAWPSGQQAPASATDWTGYTLDGPGKAVPPRLVTGMGRPLEPGRYYVGVINNSTTSAISYTIDSRGIGSGLTYPVTTLDYLSGDADINELPPREARYFKVNIPSNTPAWEVTLSADIGEVELLARLDTIPDFVAATNGSVYRQGDGCEVEMKKTGPERFVLLAPFGSDFLPTGNYYLAVVSEGVGASGTTIGSGTSSGELKSRPFLVKDLGTANAAGIVEPVALESAQVKAYKFIVPPGTDSLEVRLDTDNITAPGNPWISLVEGTRNPSPPGEAVPGIPVIGTSPFNEYGCDGGNRGLSNTRIITYANPAPGEWRVVVRAGHSPAPVTYNAAAANLVVTALSTVPLEYDGGTFTVNGHEPGTWRYFVVQVPNGIEGWDVRLRDVSGPGSVLPAMMVRRDALPSVPANLVPGNIPTAWAPWTVTSWPTENQWLGRVDWTDYLFDAAGVSVPPRIVAAKGRPLETGTYYVGVFNNTTNPTSYTVESRGIGEGRTFPVTTLAFAGGTATITDLHRREAQYFKVTIPADTPSWEVTLASTVGEIELLARAGAIPDFHAVREGNVYNSANGAEVEMKKAGPERYVLLPPPNQTLVTAGDYYLAVVSEGINPGATVPGGTTVGTGNSSGVLTSLGILGVKDIGQVTDGGITESVALAGGQMKAYQFTVPPDTDTLELRLDNPTGYPLVSVVPGTRLPIPPGYSPLGTSPHSEYGYDGGTGGAQTASFYTLTTPTPGVWSMIVRARHDANLQNPANVAFPDATGNVTIRSKPNTRLNFAEALNSGGGTNTDTRQALDGEYNVYEVTVPPTLSGEPVLGWIINTEVSQGAVSLEVYKDQANPASGITIPIGVAVVVPPYLTFNDTWYVRVKATGLTNYKITSSPVTLERSAWQMPVAHNQTFGDSGTDISGNPLPGDRGVDLKQGFWHFYAIDVPADNSGLLRTELQAISGNPDLYLREDGVPTTNHLSNGKSGVTLTPRLLNGTTTNYGNWVPLDGKTATRLRSGRWYLGVRAGGTSNVRYRLITSTGIVKQLALNPATATAQIPNFVTEVSLADNDWRYYQFTVPEAAPDNWTLTLSQQVGDVMMWLRDSAPPGQKGVNTNAAANIADWSSDRKNQGPYSAVFNNVDPVNPPFDAAGDYRVTTPPLRPGHTYYVGLRSNNSATFSLSSNASAPINVAPSLDFYAGSVTTTVPASGTLRYRILVPPEGTQFKYSSTHTTAVQVRIEQGTLPATSGTQHFVGTGANSTFNRDLAGGVWPWVPAQTYYVCFVNSSGTDQPITFTLNGKNALTEDEDNDGLPDAWEVQYFSNTTSQNGTGDPDADGVNNATEFADGTAPNNANSAKYALTLLARNGTAAVTPDQPKYDKGTVVSLSNTPSDGYAFVGWSGGPFRADDFVLKATGTITVPTSGIWTFGVNAADGSRLLVNGTQVILDNTQHDAIDKFGQINLAAGVYSIELVSFERKGGEALELFAAPGSFTTYNTDFRLVGDVANGGLPVETMVQGASTPGFTVRQVGSLSLTIDDLGDADSLLNGTIAARQEVTGVIDTLNFLTYNFSEGHFTDNAQFPLTDAIEDNPLSVTMNRNYTITALNTIPLGTALDAEGLVWRTGSNAPWLGANDATSSDNVDSASSGPIGDNESSYLQTVVTGPGTLTFKWKVSSQTSLDVFAFLIDGVQRAVSSGETGWTNSQTFTLPAGVHTLTWHYTKNASVSAGTDRAWLDQMVFTP